MRLDGNAVLLEFAQIRPSKDWFLGLNAGIERILLSDVAGRDKMYRRIVEAAQSRQGDIQELLAAIIERQQG